MKGWLFLLLVAAVFISGCSNVTPYLRGRTIAESDVDYYNRKQLIQLLSECKQEAAKCSQCKEEHPSTCKP